MATCTCGKVSWIDLKPVLSTHLAHAPWPRVMGSLSCGVCKGQPGELALDTEPGGLDMRRVRSARIRLRLAQRRVRFPHAHIALTAVST